jgi:hypothetical protein
MKEQLAALLPQDFADGSKVWIYQGSRPFSDKEEREINEQLLQFYSQWLSHRQPVKGWAKLLFKQFIVIMADETHVTIGGCSADDSQRMIKSLERQYSVTFFDRMTLTFLIKDKTEMLPFQQVPYAIEKGFINKDTLTFNNIATTKKELLHSWIVPLKESWLAQRVELPVE